jgi:hypothetical protein
MFALDFRQTVAEELAEVFIRCQDPAIERKFDQSEGSRKSRKGRFKSRAGHMKSKHSKSPVIYSAVHADLVFG